MTACVVHRGEAVTVFQAVGGALIVAGVIVVRRRGIAAPDPLPAR